MQDCPIKSGNDENIFFTGEIMFGLIPKEEKFFPMFFEITNNIVVGAETLKEMLDNFNDR